MAPREYNTARRLRLLAKQVFVILKTRWLKDYVLISHYSIALLVQKMMENKLNTHLPINLQGGNVLKSH